MDAFNALVEAHIVPASEPTGLGVELSPYPGGYSLRLSRPAKSGDLLFRIPADVLLKVPDFAERPPTDLSPASLPFFAQPVDPSSFSDELPFDDLRLILELVYQRSLGPQSKWHGYIVLLPETFPTCPLYWTEDETEQRLAGSPLFGLAEELRAQLKLAWEWTLDLLGKHLAQDQLPHYTWDSFLWAYMVVQSRAFKVAFPNKAKTETVLVPFGDMANHAVGDGEALVKNLHKVDPKTGCLEVFCGRDAEKGEEMTIHCELFSVGGFQLKDRSDIFPVETDNDLAPWQTLLHYGFSVPITSPNPFDRINLTLDFPDDDSYELEMLKRLLFETVDGLAEEQSLAKEPSDEFLASIRVALATEDELEGLSAEQVAEQCFQSGGLGMENEKRAIGTLFTMMSSLDSLYPRTLEEDVEDLEALEEDSKGKEADREALRYVVGQRLLMKAVKEWAQNKLAELPQDDEMEDEADDE